MRLSSDDGLGRLELEVFDIDLQDPRPQVGLLVRGRAHGFSGDHKAWVLLADVVRFAKELAALDQVPNGAAVLDGLNAEELNITVLSPQGDVGFVTHVRLASRQKLGGREYEMSFQGALTLPPDAVRLAAKTLARYGDPKFLAELQDWGFDEKALLDE